MRLLHLYRPLVPSLRAQAIQVVHSCEALARRGHTVTLLADNGGAANPDAALATYGLSRPFSFDLQLCPFRHKTLAGLWFRAKVYQWSQQPGVVYARAKRYVSLIPTSIPVILEAHELDSSLEREAGKDFSKTRALEEHVFARIQGLVCNCEGTLALIEAEHSRLPAHRTVIHNGTRKDRLLPLDRPWPTELQVGYTGSPKSYKGLAPVLASLPFWPQGARLELIGGAPETPLPPEVSAHPPVPYGELPGFLARYRALLLPLENNLFGRQLTSPLKLWDYLATGIPIVAADFPTTRAIGGDTLFYYNPDDPHSIGQAVARALAHGPIPPYLRSWEDRAKEVEQFIERCQR